jgi:hypothetical protein
MKLFCASLECLERVSGRDFISLWGTTGAIVWEREAAIVHAKSW